MDWSKKKELAKFYQKRSILRKIKISHNRARLQVFGVVGIQLSCSCTQKKNESFEFKRKADKKFSQKTNKFVSNDNQDFSRTRWLVTDLLLVGIEKDSFKKQRKTRVPKLDFFANLGLHSSLVYCFLNFGFSKITCWSRAFYGERRKSLPPALEQKSFLESKKKTWVYWWTWKPGVLKFPWNPSRSLLKFEGIKNGETFKFDAVNLVEGFFVLLMVQISFHFLLYCFA